MELDRKTVAETILDRKLDSFRTRLLQTSESIASLARKCGFTNVNSLRNLFLKRYGQSPRQARQATAR